MGKKTPDTVIESPEPKQKRKRRARESGDRIAVEVSLPIELHDELSALLDGRGTTMSKFFEVHARSFLRSPSIFELHTRLPFRKYAGSPVEDIVRMDPSYIRFLLGNVTGFRLSELAQKLLDQVDPQ